MRWLIRLESSRLYDCVTNQQLLLKKLIIIIFVLKVVEITNITKLCLFF